MSRQWMKTVTSFLNTNLRTFSSLKTICSQVYMNKSSSPLSWDRCSHRNGFQPGICQCLKASQRKLTRSWWETYGRFLYSRKNDNKKRKKQTNGELIIKFLSTPRCVVTFVSLTYTMSLVVHQHISIPTGTMKISLDVRTNVMTTRKSGCFVTSTDVARSALIDI